MNYNIALIKGDGIGPEISKEAVKVLKAIEKIYGHNFEINEVCGAGDAVDKFGNPIPTETLDVCIESDAVLIGNIGGSKWNNEPLDKKPVKAILKIRKALNVTSNLRPITLNQNLREFSPLKESIISKGIDILVVRDLAGSVICGEKRLGVGEFGRECSDLEYYNEEIVNRKDLGYPPFREMIYMVIRHAKEEMAESIAQKIVDDLETNFKSQSIDVNGPYEAGIKKIRDMYRLSIMIRGENLDAVKDYIYNSWIFTQEGLLIDVDPI